MCYSLLASQQSKKTPIQVFSLVHLGCSFHLFFQQQSSPTQTPNNHQQQGSFLFNLHPSPHFPQPPQNHSNTTTPSWPRRTRLFMTNSPTHSTISSPASPPWSNPSSKYSLFLSLIALFFNKICGICVIMGFDFELRGRIMS